MHADQRNQADFRRWEMPCSSLGRQPAFRPAKVHAVKTVSLRSRPPLGAITDDAWQAARQRAMDPCRTIIGLMG